MSIAHDVITRIYAIKKDQNITRDDTAFYTIENDYYQKHVENDDKTEKRIITFKDDSKIEISSDGDVDLVQECEVCHERKEKGWWGDWGCPIHASRCTSCLGQRYKCSC